MDNLSRLTRRHAIAALLLAAGIAVYGRVGGYPFINFDDDSYISANRTVQEGVTLSGIRWAFTTFHVCNWHPLTWISHMSDVSLFGMDAGAHHLVNLLFHLANTLLLFHVVRRMTGRMWESGFVAALFAVHPLHVESVAWVAERKDVLSAFFWMLAMGAYVRYAERPGWGRYGTVVLFFVLGLLSKPMVVTLPFVLLLLDFWPLRRFTPYGIRPDVPGPPMVPVPARTLFLEKVPLLLLSGASCWITFLAQRETVQPLYEFPLWARGGNALLSYAAYLAKTAWPSGLAVFYPHPGIRIVPWKTAAAGLLLILATAAAIRHARRRPWFAVGWFWYIGTLVPVIGLLQVGGQAMADRYTYIPLIGIFLSAAWGGAELVERWKVSARGVALSAGTLLLAVSVCAWNQVGYWRGNTPLFVHALEVTRDNWIAHSQLGNEASRGGRDNEALAHYREVRRILHGYADVEYALYAILRRQGKKEEAILHFNEGIRAKSSDPVTTNEVGLSFAESGNIEEAEACFREAIRIRPDYPEAHYNLAVALGRLGKKDEAIPHFREALRIPPTDAEAQNKIGVSLVRLGRFEEAIARFREAIGLRPRFGEAEYNLAVALERAGRTDEAIARFRDILRRTPKDRNARDSLERLLGK